MLFPMITVATFLSWSITGGTYMPALVVVRVAVTDSLPSTTESAVGFTKTCIDFTPAVKFTSVPGDA